ncbi:MAG: thermonuclease family protein [Deltaproteobacteria bacterium]|jgi:endonuclease YncB( thermonuclease family)|nr:thermonuclease family protein [Deltaproteobacteria bacterium]
MTKKPIQTRLKDLIQENDQDQVKVYFILPRLKCLAGLSFILLGYLVLALFPADLIAGEIYQGQVKRVADGDTIELLTKDYERVRVRLYGVDAPEKDQDGGLQSMNALKDLIDGREVTVDVLDVDRYSRLVGIIYLKSSSGPTNSVNQTMIENGQAWVYDHYCKVKKICREFDKAQKRARSSKLGLWNNPRAKPPWEYRSYKRNNPAKK